MKMKNKIILAFLCLLLNSINLSAQSLSNSKKSIYKTGFREININDYLRPLQIALVYPTSAKHPIARIGDNEYIIGENVIYDAKISDKSFPLVIFSHGLNGSWDNHIWLAAALSKRGFIVAMPNHPGTTLQDMDPQLARDMLARPEDIRRTISYLLETKQFSDHIDANNISIIGHSYGGWTAVEAIGGKSSAKVFKKECRKYPIMLACDVFNEQMKGLDERSDFLKLDKDMKDPRIKRAVILDIGFGRMFIPSSLSEIKIPVLVYSAGPFVERIPAELETGYLTKYLPEKTSKHIVLNNATHYSFMAICRKNAIELFKKDRPDQVPTCEFDTNERANIHTQLIKQISSFLVNN